MTKLQLMENPRARPGEEHLVAGTPPGAVYHDEGIFRREMSELFARSWLNVGHLSEVPKPGDFFTRAVGDESVLFIRGMDRVVRGFANVCRHRGTRLVTEERGEKLGSIVCPYHAWSYSTEGKLVGAPHTDELLDFDKGHFGLYPVSTETWGGFLWANLNERAPSLRRELGAFLARFDRFGLEGLRLGGRKVYDVNANWKIIAENYSECYHCAPIHPGLNRVTHYLTGENDAWMARGKARSLVSGGYMTFSGDYNSMTVTGYTNRPPLKGMTSEDRKRIYYYVVFPNLFFSLHPDYLMIHRDWPQSPTRTRIECEWYFDPDAMGREDFDPSDAVDMWDEINRQDWEICERTQLGVRSRSWKGGRFSSQEPLVHDLDKYYMERLFRRRLPTGPRSGTRKERATPRTRRGRKT